ncbi:MAG TPA: glycosyltransferase 87 family protein [Thermoanaerobaculia bacterium]|nr:glycosyltransferase 87 family protein [Thermoanaerobaculia bacterium]
MSSRRAGFALALLLVLAGLGSLWIRGRSTAGMDFYQMWIGARMARETADFYAPETRARMGEIYLREAAEEDPASRRTAVAQYRRNLEVLSTPLLYTIYAPLQLGYESAFAVFQLIVIASLLAWVALFTRLYGFDPFLQLLFLGFLLFAFEPVRSDAGVGNMNHIILLMLAVAALLTARRWFALAGATLAIAILVKPYVILTIPVTYLFWIASRRWRDLGLHAAGAAAAAAIGLAASSLYFRSAAIWPDWLEAFRAMPESMIPVDVGNFALRAFIGPSSVIAFLIAGAALAAIAFRTRPGVEIDVPAIALGCVLFQFVSPLVWVHHLLLTVPLVAWLLRPAASRGTHIAGAIALALIAVEPWGTFVPSVLGVAVLVNLGLAIAFAAALVSVSSSAVPRSS